MRRIVVIVASIIAASFVAHTGCADTLDAPAGGAPVGYAERPAARLIGEFIERLKGESLEESLSNLDIVDEYYSPTSGAMLRLVTGWGDTFCEAGLILANRRFAKIHAELLQLDGEAQYALLSRHFEEHLKAYERILSACRNDANPGSDEIGDLARVSGHDEAGPSANGTRHAIAAIALVSGMLGSERMWEEMRPAMAHPVAGFAMREEDYDARALRLLSKQPVFLDAVRAQVAFLMAQNADASKAAAANLDVARVLAAAPESATRVMELYDYRATVTPFDTLHMDGAPLDRRYKTREVKFLVRPEPAAIAAVLEAARQSAEGLAGGVAP